MLPMGNVFKAHCTASSERSPRPCPRPDEFAFPIHGMQPALRYRIDEIATPKLYFTMTLSR